MSNPTAASRVWTDSFFSTSALTNPARASVGEIGRLLLEIISEARWAILDARRCSLEIETSSFGREARRSQQRAI